MSLSWRLENLSLRRTPPPATLTALATGLRRLLIPPASRNPAAWIRPFSLDVAAITTRRRFLETFLAGRAAGPQRRPGVVVGGRLVRRRRHEAAVGGLAVGQLVDGVGDHGVGAGTALHVVGEAIVGLDGVVAGAGVDRVRAGAAEDLVVAVAGLERVVAVLAADLVVARPGVDRVVALVAGEVVVRVRQRGDRVGAGASGDDRPRCP